MIKTKRKPPRNIYSAIKLFCIALVLATLRTIAGIEMVKEPTVAQTIIVISVPLILFGAFLIYMIYKGKDWARITELVLFIVGIVLNIGNIILWFHTAPLLFKIYIMEIIFTIIALIIIFQNKSSKWFKDN
ncbi:hypothetical protein SH2C18_36300 [Clostridium sediminicola]|uniref:hypothetical protein n=1 Tax=Clostridium sediminicola TaxID=3114879 RepID=UPI0031F22291